MRLPWKRGYIEGASWLSDGVLLAVGWSLAPAGALTARLERAGSSSLALEMRALGVSRPDLPDDPHPIGKVLVVRFPPGSGRMLEGNLVLEGDGSRFFTSPDALSRVTGEAAAMVSARLGWLGAPARAELVSFLAQTMNDVSPATPQLAGSLREIRSILRGTVRPALNADYYAHLDQIFRLDERSYYVTGWMPDRGSEHARVTAVSPEGHRAELLPGAFRHRRGDLAERMGASPGFAAFVRLEGPSLADFGWTVERHANGIVYETDGPPVNNDGAAAEEAILAGLQFEDPARPRLIPDHAFPAITRLRERRGEEPRIEEVVDVGAGPTLPDVSLVVPLFRRLDLLEHQFAHFVDDPEIGARAELVFVLDSPELSPEAKGTLSDLRSLYRVPYRLALLRHHSGFSLAVNAGVSIAKGRLVVLLNSDVFPVQPGWVGELARSYDATPRIGALGPKLLFEDDTLQHAGMYFQRPHGCAVWMNKHFYKGFDRRWPEANVARTVPAVTGACLMIARRTFLDQGGLRDCYLDGDYEDSDLCLRLSAAGYENWYAPEVELYHLEGQSYDWDPKRLRRSFYNAWVHDHFWNDTIEKVMRASQNNPIAAPRG